MSVPDFQTIMLPLLQIASAGKERSFKDVREELVKHFSLTEEELNVLLPSGKQSLFPNRAGWAKTYLTQAGALESRTRGPFKITERGRQILAEKPERITVKYLDRFPEFVEFRTSHNRTDAAPIPPQIAEEKQTPEEVFEASYQRLRHETASELLSRIKQSSPAFFEQLVIDLLLKMGYGGSRAEAGKVLGRSGDEGIDGLIKQDRLGLDVIYVQAKKWEGTVGRPEIHKFVGALHGQRARRGIFITTSSFSEEAENFARTAEYKIVLIDGHQLVEYMIDFDLGVTPSSTYQLKKIDSDYFGEE